MGLQTRVEGVVSELVQTICDALVSPDDTSDAAIVALACILDHAPQDKIGEQTRASVVGCLESAFHAEETPHLLTTEEWKVREKPHFAVDSDP